MASHVQQDEIVPNVKQALKGLLAVDPDAVEPKKAEKPKRSNKKQRPRGD